MSCGALPITLESSTATTPPSWALRKTQKQRESGVKQQTS
jgi:hypothetical protein